MVKSLRLENVAGQVNLRGKRERLMNCGCCVVSVEPKERELAKEAEREIAEAKNGEPVCPACGEPILDEDDDGTFVGHTLYHYGCLPADLDD